MIETQSFLRAPHHALPYQRPITMSSPKSSSNSFSSIRNSSNNLSSSNTISNSSKSSSSSSFSSSSSDDHSKSSFSKSLTTKSTRSLVCDDCKRKFSRIDAKTRHLQTCPARRTTPPRAGRKVCDGCATAKARCDYGLPCGRCRSRDMECHYSNPNNRIKKLAAMNEAALAAAASNSSIMISQNHSNSTQNSSSLNHLPHHQVILPMHSHHHDQFSHSSPNLTGITTSSNPFIRLAPAIPQLDLTALTKDQDLLAATTMTSTTHLLSTPLSAVSFTALLSPSTIEAFPGLFSCKKSMLTSTPEDLLSTTDLSSLSIPNLTDQNLLGYTPSSEFSNYTFLEDGANQMIPPCVPSMTSNTSNVLSYQLQYQLAANRSASADLEDLYF